MVIRSLECRWERYVIEAPGIKHAEPKVEDKDLQLLGNLLADAHRYGTERVEIMPAAGIEVPHRGEIDQAYFVVRYKER